MFWIPSSYPRGPRPTSSTTSAIPACGVWSWKSAVLRCGRLTSLSLGPGEGTDTIVAEVECRREKKSDSWAENHSSFTFCVESGPHHGGAYHAALAMQY